MMDGDGEGDPARGWIPRACTDIPILELRGEVRGSGFLRARSAKRPNSPLSFGDRNTYQMDPANGDEAMKEVAIDLAEARGHDYGEAGVAIVLWTSSGA